MAAPGRLNSTVDIAASDARVWELLTDFAAFPEWNPFIPKTSGVIEAGKRIEVVLQPPGRKPTTFRPKLLPVVPEREFRWLGHVGIPGIFDGEHASLIEPMGNNRVRFTQQESFPGILRPFLGGLLRDSGRGFGAMNEALKARAEGEGT
ncbi:MAG: SRPBCC family protein [Thermoplasmata archaeon]